ncbi:Uma2 family endonuclease [Nocardioides sp. Soil796]|uniref:Uma2 family endonuclease n=1 Tax=Nocardioides sp. Soil796 TaxID=1736412 RepID=UPI000708E67D|nr:Uma2 family endonuclease [Nocardioides sp. Soil796]KRF12835.1 hypothetical protein ASH02_15035 [Nocardioides sp. Soil796]
MDELIDRALLVTPAPSVRHQIVSGELYAVLRAACPAHLRVLTAPLDVVLTQSTGVQPDLLVAAREDFTEKNLPAAPLLAAWELRAGAYVEVADVAGDESWTAQSPYGDTVVPSALLA